MEKPNDSPPPAPSEATPVLILPVSSLLVSAPVTAQKLESVCSQSLSRSGLICRHLIAAARITSDLKLKLQSKAIVLKSRIRCRWDQQYSSKSNLDLKLRNLLTKYQ